MTSYLKAFLCGAILLTACKTNKKSTQTTYNSKPNYVLANKTYKAPETSEKQLEILQKTYKDLNLETLKQGYFLYTQGACINCHQPKDINLYNTEAWQKIVEDMGNSAKLNASEKDAVYKYVLAIKTGVN